MALKFKYKTKEEVPADQAGFYTEREGAWLLDVDGAADKAKLEEFRNSNVALVKERDELRQRFEGIDPNEVRKLADEKRKLEEAAQIKAGEADKVIEGRLKAARSDWDKQFSAVTAERDALNSRLTAIQIDQAVVSEATKRGLRASAMPDITARARGAFKLVNGFPTAFEADGQSPKMGKDGVTPMSLAEWVDLLVSDAPHLFEPSAGSGAAGSASGGSINRSVKNPYRKETWNLTEQMKLQRSDPALAARLKAAA
jgi:hypothetical protein